MLRKYGGVSDDVDKDSSLSDCVSMDFLLSLGTSDSASPGPDAQIKSAFWIKSASGAFESSDVAAVQASSSDSRYFWIRRMAI